MGIAIGVLVSFTIWSSGLGFVPEGESDVHELGVLIDIDRGNPSRSVVTIPVC